MTAPSDPMSMAPDTATTERRKYQRMWAMPEYSQYSPGEQFLRLFPGEPIVEVAALDGRKIHTRHNTVIDLGCGTGRVGLALKERGFHVTLADHVDAREPAVKQAELPFLEVSLWSEWNGHWDYGYCCDVMEHIPTEYVMATLEQIAAHCDHVFFSINNLPDGFGRTIGEQLHLTIRPFQWWLAKMREIGFVKQGRDLLVDSVFWVDTRRGRYLDEPF
jgi:2-polyprenyl-3-methyl-5-hydroxy-6-metoxy-1,4-benzoquinol methylase